MTPPSAPRDVILLGPAASGQGGISSVVRGYLGVIDGPVRFQFVPTTPASGGRGAKLRAAITAFPRLTALLVRYRRAPVHAHVSVGASFVRKLALVAVARLARHPVVLHLHSGRTPDFVTGGWAPRKALVRVAFRLSSAVVVLNPAWVAPIEAVTDRPVFVVPNGVPLPEPSDATGSGSPMTVVSLGRLCDAKGTFDLVAAFGRADHTDARLVLAGDGDPAPVHHAARRAGVEDRVTTVGWLDPEAGAALLHEASVFVLASHAEGLPMAVLEAMAAGVPVVASRVGAIPELIRHGENGLLVEPSDVEGIANALIRLLGDPTLRARLASAGRRTVADGYSVDGAVEQLEAIYRGIAP